MPLSDDPWIAEYSIIDPERLHALGSIVLWWNHCERNLLFIFTTFVGVSQGMGWIIGHDLGDMALSTRIREILKRRDHPSGIVGERHCLKPKKRKEIELAPGAHGRRLDSEPRIIINDVNAIGRTT